MSDSVAGEKAGAINDKLPCSVSHLDLEFEIFEMYQTSVESGVTQGI